MAKTHEVERYNPIQIMPCEPGWTVHYWEDDGRTLQPSPDILAMWALCEWETRVLNSETREAEKTIRHSNVICGVIVAGGEGMTLCEETGNMAGYKPPSVSLEEFKRQMEAERSPSRP